jgi:hypothetical protein
MDKKKYLKKYFTPFFSELIFLEFSSSPLLCVAIYATSFESNYMFVKNNHFSSVLTSGSGSGLTSSSFASKKLIIYLTSFSFFGLIFGVI